VESEIGKKMADFDGVLLSIDISCKMEGAFPILLKLSLYRSRKFHRYELGMPQYHFFPADTDIDT